MRLRSIDLGEHVARRAAGIREAIAAGDHTSARNQIAATAHEAGPAAADEASRLGDPTGALRGEES